MMLDLKSAPIRADGIFPPMCNLGGWRGGGREHGLPVMDCMANKQ